MANLRNKSDHMLTISSVRKFKHVREPRPTVLFILDDRVTWTEDDQKVVGTVVGLEEDDHMVCVRLDSDGTVVKWPANSERIKKIEKDPPPLKIDENPLRWFKSRG